MLGGRGIFLSRAGILVIILGLFVIVPTVLASFGVEHPFVAFFTEPFTAFAVIFLIGMASTFQLLRPHWISLVHISFILLGAFVYVWALLM